MSKGRILLISWHFYPSPEVGAKRPSETALYLARQGYDVTVLCAEAKHAETGLLPEDARLLKAVVSIAPPRKLITSTWKGIKRLVRHAPRLSPSQGEADLRPAQEGQTRKWKPPSWLRRQILAYDTLLQGNKMWLLSSVVHLWLLSRRQRFEVVIASGPPTVAYVCAWIVARFRSAKLILDYRDPWYLHDDAELNSLVTKGHPLAAFEDSLAGKCALKADAIVAASPGIKRHILERFHVAESSVHVVRNGYDRNALLGSPPPIGKLEFLFSGTLYLNRNPFPFLEVLHNLIGEGVQKRSVRVRFVGNCERWRNVDLQPWIAEHSMADVVEILPFVDAAELATLVAESNVLINFAQGQPRQIPAKSYEYIASGRDVLVVAERNSDVADLFREAGIGRVVEPDDYHSLTGAIRELYEKYVLRERGLGVVDDACVGRYSRAFQLERFSAILADVLEKSVTA